jgi:2-polyprenyl-3-methyl-5-hydroxy-6-metoxy-1,4-benzoquinol methylase
MKKTALEKNKEYANKYVQDVSNPILPVYLRNFIHNKKISKIIDLGCGDGFFIRGLKIFDNSIKVTGVDISSRRIQNLKKIFSKDKFYCTDVCDTKIRDKFDFVYSSQVIEHMENDKKMVEEITRLTKSKGYVHVSSIIKKPLAIYQYKNNGKFVLDPTHEKEYKNQKEFLDLFQKDFKLISSNISKVTRKKFGILFTIPGFFHVEGFWQKRK